MPEVTGYTKARMDEIDNTTFASVSATTGALILTTNDSTQVSAGDATGPIGDQGAPSTVTQQDIDDAVDALKHGDWVALPILAGWQQYSTFPIPQYRVIQDRVWLKGTVQYTGANVAAGTYVLITSAFPVALRPAYHCILGGSLNNRIQADIRMQPTGMLGVWINSYLNTNELLMLNGLSYPLT